MYIFIITGQLFTMAPDLDFIAPQDSMGAQGNSFANVSSYLGQLALTSRQHNRRVLSNVELFQVWSVPLLEPHAT